jgi:6-phosphofructokinase
LRVGVLTSGGDAPGMNAAVRAAFFRGWDVMGIWAGYRGLLEGRIYPMDRRRLGGIIHRGGPCSGPNVRPSSQRRRDRDGPTASSPRPESRGSWS